MRAVRLDARGDITPDDIGDTNESIAWVHPKRGNYMQTPILVDDRLYGCDDNGVLSCFNALTGEIYYRERLGRGGGGFTASPVSDGRHLYFAGEILDIDGITGGFNFQNAWTTAWIAGNAIT